jgi:hypothetical protein
MVCLTMALAYGCLLTYLFFLDTHFRPLFNIQTLRLKIKRLDSKTRVHGVVDTRCCKNRKDIKFEVNSMIRGTLNGQQLGGRYGVIMIRPASR